MSDPTPSSAVRFVADRGGRFKGLMVPTGILLSIAAASFAGVWSGARFVYGGLATQIVENRAAIEAEARNRIELERRVVVLEITGANLARSVEDLNRKVDRVIDILINRPMPATSR